MFMYDIVNRTGCRIAIKYRGHGLDLYSGLSILAIAFIMLLSGGASAQEMQPARIDIVPSQIVYQRHGDVELVLHLFRPTVKTRQGRLPAIIFFHGGGWSSGSPEQFFRQSEYLASRGMIAISAQYRLLGKSARSIDDCIADARAAVAWVRSHAAELDIDPDRIAAGGGSAGGHLAAMVATLKSSSKFDGSTVSSVPNALVLYNPVVDLRTRFGAKTDENSPIAHIRPGLPPTIIFHGENDQTVPITDVERFCHLMREASNSCSIVVFKGAAHGFFNAGQAAVDTLQETDKFLTSLGYISSK